MTNPNNAIRTLNAGSTSDQMTMGTNLANSMTIIATVKLETKEGKLHFELELESRRGLLLKRLLRSLLPLRRLLLRT